MPFIFHSQKHSIFQSKLQNPKSIPKHKIQCAPANKSQCPSPNKYIFTLCKEHPFRKFAKSNDKPPKLTENTQSNWNRENAKPQRPFKKYAYKPWKNNDYSENKHSPKSSSFTINHQDPNLFSNAVKQGLRVHTPGSPPPQSLNKREKSFKKIIQQPKHQQRLKYVVDKNPGPGTYDVTIPKNEKTTVLYQGPSFNISLPEPKRNSLEKILLSIEEKLPKREGRSFMADCNYKNQNSPSFKESLLKKPTSKKNEALLNMLFSRKHSDNKENQSESTCESRFAGTPNSELYEDGYEKDEAKQPGPFAYDPNIDCTQQNKQNKLKPFLTGEPKHLSYLNRRCTPGPGTYITAPSQMQNKQDFDQNQNKRPNRFEDYDYVAEDSYAFMSGVARELRFDNENLCRQEFYYSPKNNMNEIVEMRIEKGNRSNKAQFGSSLERFEKEKVIKQDPYKYCYAKTNNAEVTGSVPSLTFTEKREVFKPVQDTVAPNRYYNNANTIYKLTEKELFRKLLQSKYQDEVVLMKQKKSNMERLLIEQNRKSVNIKNAQKVPQELYLDNYKEYLMGKKMAEKENIVFGYHKQARIDRTTEPRKELDHYYETEPKWEVRSFNKEYGYELAEK